MKKIIAFSLGVFIIGIVFLVSQKENLKTESDINYLTGTIIEKNRNEVTVQDEDNIIYTFI